MTTAAQIIQYARTTLQDTGTRWPDAELLAYLCDGQREIASMRPDMFSVTMDLDLVPGYKQSLPPTCSKFGDILRNKNGAAIRQTDRAMLDAVEPSWYTRSPSKTIKHFCYDPRDAYSFVVYPPAATGASVVTSFSTVPADVAAVDSLTVNAVFHNALLNYVLFRAYAKDAESASNAALSASYFQLFKAGVVEESAPRQAVQPTPSN